MNEDRNTLEEAVTSRLCSIAPEVEPGSIDDVLDELQIRLAAP